MTDFSTLDDDALAKLIRKDSTAFSILYQRYFRAVYQYVYHRIGNAMDAEDLTSKVFVNVLNSLMNRQYSREGKFPAWLFTIARHRVIDFYRKNPSSQTIDTSVDVPDTSQTLDTIDDIAHLGHLLAQLDEDTQELMRLRFSAGLEYAAIARIVGRKEPAVKMKIYRTLSQLQDRLEGNND